MSDSSSEPPSLPSGDDSRSVIESRKQQVVIAASTIPEVPAILAKAGAAGAFAWDEFFAAQVRNKNTRRAYVHAVHKFLTWCGEQSLELQGLTPGMIGRYFDQHGGSIPTKKLHLAAIRGLFDVLVQRHVIILNPALSVRTERYSAIEGKTPEITVEQARTLIASIKATKPIDLRDLAILSVLVYTGARVGAVARLRIGDLVNEGNQFALRFAEKGGKSRSIPVRHDLQQLLESYLGMMTGDKQKDQPLFRAAVARSSLLTARSLTGVDICRMVKRRLLAAGLPTIISPHSFRSCTATDLLLQGVPLEDVQHLLGHADARTTRLYDRRQKKVTRNIVERISV